MSNGNDIHKGVLCGAMFRADVFDEHSETHCCVLYQGHAGRHTTRLGVPFPGDPVAVTKAWRDKHEKDYAELVTFVRALSAAPVYQGMYLLAYWRKDAQTLLKLLNGER